MAIASTTEEYSHSVVVDGYDENTGQFHLNMGWGESYNLWYSLPNVSIYDIVEGVAYNLSPFGVLRGTVTCSGEAVTDATIQVTPGDFTIQTDDQGYYEFTDLPSGLYTLSISKSAYNPVSFTDVSVAAADTTTVDAELEMIPQITVITPNGGESWISGTSHIVSWSSAAVDSILAEYSTDSGSTWIPIDTFPALDGAFSWVVPEAAADEALVRLSALTALDISDNTFTIIEDGLWGDVDNSLEVDIVDALIIATYGIYPDPYENAVSYTHLTLPTN